MYAKKLQYWLGKATTLRPLQPQWKIFLYCFSLNAAILVGFSSFALAQDASTSVVKETALVPSLPTGNIEAQPSLAPATTSDGTEIARYPAEQLALKLRELETRLESLKTTTASLSYTNKGLWKLEVGGSGEFSFTYHNFGPDQTQEGGARPDHRLVFDTTRFVVDLEGKMPYGIEFEAEIEIEHGGTGSALELEFEEFGEFEMEVEKGGEVVLEELYLEKKFGDRVAVLAGRFNVALGTLSKNHRPTDFYGTARPESETRVIPAVWDEMGVELHYKHPWFRATAQVVNGLDSTGFSSQQWIASGKQQRFELVSATDLAFVARIDIVGFEGIVFGASTYISPNTTNNRPKPDLENVSAPLLLSSAHIRIDLAPIRARSSIVWGHLWKAARISDRNRRLSNNLDVLRTPVADEAISLWAELGINLFHFAESISPLHQLEPFLRAEYYDTMFRVDADIFDNPRFKRTLLSVGINYTFNNSIVTKFDWTHRRLGSKAFRKENTLSLSAGFIF